MSDEEKAESKVIMAYMGRRLDSKGKTSTWWFVEEDASTRSWSKKVQRAAMVGGRYQFDGSFTDDGKLSITLNSGTYLGNHDKQPEWIAEQRADDQIIEAKRREKKAGSDHELEEAIEVLAERIFGLNTSQSAAWMQWLITQVHARVSKRKREAWKASGN